MPFRKALTSQGFSMLDLVSSSHLPNSNAPTAPASLADLGLEPSEVLNLTTKALYSGANNTAAKLSQVLKIPTRLVAMILQDCQDRKLIEVVAKPGFQASANIEFQLTAAGRSSADAAFEQSLYVGPVPVPFSVYCDQVTKQAIGAERISEPMIRKGLGDLLMADNLVKQIGPAVNSGQSILLYGPPGNGKTSVAERIGNIFNATIYVPHCFEIGGQIIKVFDPAVHKEVRQDALEKNIAPSIMRDETDHRWVACRRPFIVTGGELTLEMLDLSFNPLAKFYEAPLHIKALNGIFLIDDFGRQIVSPEALLNRWIVPLASRVDYLKLHTGKSFSIPFDELVIFSTNLAPNQLMDPAFLRRIPYKIEIGAPSLGDYHEIFNRIASKKSIAIEPGVVDMVVDELTVKNAHPLGGYQPGFLLDQAISQCKYEGLPPQFTKDMIGLAINNLFAKESDGFGMIRQS